MHDRAVVVDGEQTGSVALERQGVNIGAEPMDETRWNALFNDADDSFGRAVRDKPTVGGNRERN